MGPFGVVVSRMSESNPPTGPLVDGSDAPDGHRVGVAEMAISTDGTPLSTAALGSCVAVGIRTESGVGGLLHAMVPRAPTAGDTAAKYVDSGIHALENALRDRGGRVGTLTAKLTGGSFMVDIGSVQPVNEQNVQVAKAELSDRGIDLVAEDTGGRTPRSVEYDPRSGEMYIFADGAEQSI
jgi:chemotaxis protein CheD